MVVDAIDYRYVKFIEDCLIANKFAQLLGIKISRLGPGYAEHFMDLKNQHNNPYSVVHGGVIMSLGDITMGNAVRSTGTKGLTLDCNTSFISTAYEGDRLICRADILKSGKRISYVEARIMVGEKLIANCTGTFLNIGLV